MSLPHERTHVAFLDPHRVTGTLLLANKGWGKTRAEREIVRLVKDGGTSR